MTKLKKCVICSIEFDALSRNFGRGRQSYCSAKCRQVADNRRHYRRRNPPKSVEELSRACIVCGVQFVADKFHPNALTCSVKCSEARINAERRRQAAETYDAIQQKECAECGAKFSVGRSASKSGPKAPKFCSAKCAHRAAQRAHSQRTVRVKDTRLSVKAWKDAKVKAMERDSGKCRQCGGVATHVHHLFHRTEAEMYDHSLENLVALCNSCHSKIHKIKIGRIDGEIVVSGVVFNLLNVKTVRIA